MKNEITTSSAFSPGEIMERVIALGDLGKLTSEERVQYYNKTCESLGLNPFTRPFEYITLNGKLQLYARKDATEQLRKIQGVSITKLEKENAEGVYTVTAYAKDKNERTDASTGAVNINGLKGDALANAFMKAETKAKRRVTLSIVGLGLLDESEIEALSGAKLHEEPKNITPKKYEPKPSDINRRLTEFTFTELDGSRTKGMFSDEVLGYMSDKIQSIESETDLELYRQWQSLNKELIKIYFKENRADMNDLMNSFKAAEGFIKRDDNTDLSE